MSKCLTQSVDIINKDTKYPFCAKLHEVSQNRPLIHNDVHKFFCNS